MERFVRVRYGLYQGYGNTVPLGQPGLSGHRQPDWRQNMGPPIFLARPGLLVPANAPDYCMDSYKRAQFKAILSQMNPSLSPRLCKANTKEVGVQVSPRVDKAVQCSLGSRTLSSCSSWDVRDPRGPLPACGVTSPATGHRGLIRLQRDEDERKSKALPGPAETSQPRSPPPRSEADRLEEPGQLEESGEKDAARSQETKSKQAPGDTPAKPLRRPNFQFLEPKYGYFHCKDCKTRWESAYVWCISGTNKVYFKQLCCKCQKSFNPYRVEAIQCQLCGRCKDKRFSCGNIYSFKYVM
uniref:3CxxC-type domain-containing protein n=1 Tax=Saimiri boliviensis boliviensis TaxID=39432 RepID=A0A2K6S5W0_SAIBB